MTVSERGSPISLCREIEEKGVSLRTFASKAASNAAVRVATTSSRLALALEDSRVMAANEATWSERIVTDEQKR